MQKHTVFFFILLVSAVFVVTSSQGYPTAEVSRGTNINVAADSNSVIQLTPNTSYGMVELNNDGELNIRPQNVGAQSVNANMTLTLGNTTSPSSNYAFTINTLNGQTTVFNISLDPAGSYTSTADSVQFIVQKNTGSVTTISANNTTKTFTVQPSDTLYVTVRVDTVNEQSGNLDTILRINAKS